MAQQKTMAEYAQKEEAGSVSLTDRQSAAINTAFNRMEKYDIYGYGDSLERSIRSDAIKALNDQIESLRRVKGKATLYDPNDKNRYLKWSLSALEKLEESKSAS